MRTFKLLRVGHVLVTGRNAVQVGGGVAPMFDSPTAAQYGRTNFARATPRSASWS